MKFKVSNKSWILLSTTIIIGIAFSVYFLVYVKGKEKDIISNNFRVLQQIVLNIESLKESYQRNAETYYNNLDSAWTIKDDAKINELNNNLEPLNKIDSQYIKDDQDIIFGEDGLIFKVKGSNKFDDAIFFKSNYDVFFNNPLFYRADIFDQIIISRIKDKDSSKSRVLFSNSMIGVLDSAFFQKMVYSAKNEVTITDKNYISFNQKIDDDYHIYISGLVEASKFNRQKRSVSPYIIFIMSVMLILIVLAMPLLKLKIMSIYERLYLTDVSFSIISVLVGPAIFIVFMYAVFIYFGFERDTIENRLHDLSEKIENNMQLELMNIVHQIKSINSGFSDVSKKSRRYDNVFYPHGIAELKETFQETTRSEDQNRDTNYRAFDIMGDLIDWKNLKYNKVTKGDFPIQGYRVFENSILSDSIDYKHLKAAFWADESAQLMILLSGFHQPSYVQDLSHRYYLTNILNKKPDIFYDTSNVKREIAIESIKSVNDGSYEVGVGMATGNGNEDLPVFAIATKMTSVMNPILEEGFGFCILDKSGRTLFHSDITKNMNENFIDETDEVFGQAITSQRAICRISNYNGIDQTIYLRPLNCLSDMYIATFIRDESHFGVFTLSMVSSFTLFFIFLIYVFLVYLVLYLFVTKTTKLKQMSYLFNYFRPYETENMQKVYLKLISAFSVGILYLVFSMWLSSEYFDFLVGELLLITTLLIVFSFHTIVNQLSKDQLMHFVIRLPHASFLRILSGLLVLILLIRFVYIIVNYEIYDIWIMLNSIIGIGVVFLILRVLLLNKQFFNFSSFFKEKDNIKRTQQVYKVYLILWVFLLSIIPIHIFLDITIKSEQSIFKKYKAHQLAMRMNEWEDQTESEFINKFETRSDFNVFLNSMKSQGLNRAIDFSLDSSTSRQLKGEKIKVYKHTIFDMLYGKIRPKYNDRVSATNNYIADSATNLSWYAKKSADSLYFILNPKFSDADFNIIKLQRGKILSSNFPMIIFNNLISIVILIIFLSFIIKRVYGFGYKQFARNVEPLNCDNQIKKYLNKDLFSNASAYNNIFFVGVNTAHFSYIKTFLMDEKRKFFSLDFYDFNELQLGNSNKEFEAFEKLVSLGRFQKEWEEIKKHFDEDSEIYILIEHFEYGYNDIEMNKLKLEVLKYLIDCENFKVIIKSEINPTKLLEYYESSIKRIEEPIKKANANDNMVLREKLDKLKVDYKKWQHLLGCFIKVIVPINIFHENNSICTQGDDEHLIAEALKQEVNHGEYLNMIKRYMDQKSTTTLTNEDQVLMVQQMSYPYYFSVWNSLSKEERYLVYDIAKDKYVNTTNTNAILSLLSKGILIYDHSLRLMNDSFTNFVLTKVSSDEALEMELISRKKGTWNTAFAVILLFIISLVIFLSIGQQNFLNDLNAFLTAIVALVGLLIRFSGVISLGSAKMADSS